VVTLTVSDSRSLADDRSGDRLAELLAAEGYVIDRRGPVRDDLAALAATVASIVREGVDALVLTGGTGVAPRDVTPEAVERVLEKRLDGFGEEFRRRSIAQVGPRGMLSRAVMGIANKSVVVALPGSVKAVELGVELLVPILGHAIDLSRGRPTEHR
jgi:molybdenum cofactor biosynthesis protein B